jgi:hypothetical protein
MTVLEQIKHLAEQLNLSFETQDWGIINATAHRTEEFIDYFNANHLSDAMKYQLLELILASFNEALLEGTTHQAVADKLAGLHSNHAGNETLKPLFTYWKNLGEEFPVSGWLRGVLDRQ